MRPYSVVDEILILLLIIGAVFLAAQWLLFRFHVKKDRYWNALPRKEKAAARRRIYNHLYRFPGSTLRHDYPHLADAADATKAYERLNRLYEEGALNEKEYDRELEKLLPKINLEQDF